MLMLCGLPQLIKSIQTKSAGDLSLSFLVTWFLGEVFMVIHLLMKDTWTFWTGILTKEEHSYPIPNTSCSFTCMMGKWHTAQFPPQPDSRLQWELKCCHCGCHGKAGEPVRMGIIWYCPCIRIILLPETYCSELVEWTDCCLRLMMFDHCTQSGKQNYCCCHRTCAGGINTRVNSVSNVTRAMLPWASWTGNTDGCWVELDSLNAWICSLKAPCYPHVS